MADFLLWGVIGIVTGVDSYIRNKSIGWALLAWIGWPIYGIYRMLDAAYKNPYPGPIEAGIITAVKDTYARAKKKKDVAAEADIKEFKKESIALLKRKSLIEKELSKLEAKKHG